MKVLILLCLVSLLGTAAFADNFTIRFAPSETGIAATGYYAEWRTLDGSSGWNTVLLNSPSGNPDGSLSHGLELNLQEPIEIRVRATNVYGVSEASSSIQLGKPNAPVLLAVEPTE